ncbi:MAG TPA: FAD-dependent oxidoreductase [Flavobacteriaceae bacterium]|nr:FAD-dependent oxidoreductase [Flavobacteriaceae bacterium]
MNLSYWEIKSWLSNVDFAIVGSGIVGLNCAIQLKIKNPKANILILERGVLPQGASTKNAGFACFGSLSEILEDLNFHTEEEVLELLNKRITGLKTLREVLGDKTIEYKQHGGFELFKNDDDFYSNCLSKREYINKLLNSIFKEDVFVLKDNIFNFKDIKEQCVFNPFEGQLDTGKMMDSLMSLALNKGIKILNNVSVETFSDEVNSVKIMTDQFEFSTSKLIIATNGFASKLLNEDVKPARAQVLITKPIKDLHIKGTFHIDKGFYYFRNINDRILLGGGRNLDIKGEETMEFGETKLIQNQLENLLERIILPNTPFEIDMRWSGIMGVGGKKKAIVKQISNRVFCGVRLGGMGVAIGSSIGKEIADLV